MIDPLADLDAVPWATLEHVYGPAADVPDQLRRLRAPAGEDRTRARAHLHAALDHQGVHRGEATLRAVPFLIALLADAATPDRAALVKLLAEFAVGDTWWWLHNGFHPALQVEPDGCSRAQAWSEIAGADFRVRSFPDPGPALDLTPGHGLREIYMAVAAAIPVGLAALDEADEELRTTVPYLLGLLTPFAEDTVPRLVRALEADPSPRVRASAALGLSHAAKFSPPYRAIAAAALLAAWGRTPAPLERRCLALALVRLEDEAISAPVLPALHHALAHGVAPVAPGGGWPWQRIDAAPFVFCTLLIGSREDRRAPVIASAVHGLHTVTEPHDACDLAAWLVTLAVPELAAGAPPSALPPIADDVLRAVVAADPAWHYTDVSKLLAARGLPAQRAWLSAWLGAHGRT